MNDHQLQRDFGRMESEIKSLTAAVHTLTTDVREVRQTLAEARGGWRVLMLVGGLAATIGGIVAKFLPMLWQVK